MKNQATKEQLKISEALNKVGIKDFYLVHAADKGQVTMWGNLDPALTYVMLKRKIKELEEFFQI